LVIAIDGPAGSGKSSVAKMLAQKLSAEGDACTFVNSGNLYRALTFAAQRAGVDVEMPELVLAYVAKLRLDYFGEIVYIDGKDVTAKLHSGEVDAVVAKLSENREIRLFVNDVVRKIAKGRNIVVEGRDMTTVVFPDAEHRFYLDASLDARAGRRFSEGQSGLSLEEVKNKIAERDEIDKKKAFGALIIADGVDYIDTSRLTLDEVYTELLQRIEKKKVEKNIYKE
jgi:cytidylate kinase